VGAPGERGPHLNEVVAFFEALSPAVRQNAVLVPYGQDPEACAAFAQSLADRLGIAVRAYHALPYYATDGTRGFAVFNADGRPERLTDDPERVYVRASAGPAHRKAGVRERGLMDAATKAMFIHRPPRRVFAADAPHEGHGPEDFDALEPVVFEVPVAPATQPTAALDGSACAAPVTEETPVTGGAVTVDARGVMRPAGPWPGASTGLATRAPGPVASVSTDAPPGAGLVATAFPMTVSTAFPQMRPATRAAGTPIEARRPGTPDPGRPAQVPYAREPVEPTGAPPVASSSVEPFAPAPKRERAELPSRAPHETGPPAHPDVAQTRAEPGQSRAEPDRVAGNPMESPEVRPAVTAIDRDLPGSAVPPDAAISRAAALPEVAYRVSPEARVFDGPAIAPVPPDAVVPSEEPVPGAVAGVPEPTSCVAADIALSPGQETEVPDASPEAASLVPPHAAASPDAVPSVPPEAEAPVVPQRDYDRLWLAERMSTPDERHAFRASLGWRYDAAVRSVARLLAEHPGLRGAATDEALMTELAAVRVFVSRDEAALVESIRAGAGEGDDALAVCAAAGLRRLPSLQGVVVRGGPLDATAADAYRMGEDLVEAAPLIAFDDVGAPVPPLGSGPRRVLLAEVPATKTGPAREKWIARVAARLQEAAANRPAPSGGTDDRFTPLPGDPLRSMP
jgi:hypothetical protein